jgi:hypothetical protein
MRSESECRPTCAVTDPAFRPHSRSSSRRSSRTCSRCRPARRSGRTATRRRCGVPQDGCALSFAQLDEPSCPKLHDRPGPSGASRPGSSAHSGTAGQAPTSVPKSVHTVPVIICVDDGGSLPIARATFALSSEHTTRMASATTCRGSRHSGVRTETCAPTQHPGPQRGRRSSAPVPGPCSIRSSWPRSGWSLLAPTSPIEYWRSSSRARDRGRQPQPAGADADASDWLEPHRWYRSSGASQRCGEYLRIGLADNTTSKFLK